MLYIFDWRDKAACKIIIFTTFNQDKTEDGKPREIRAGYCKKNRHLLWVYEVDKGWHKPDDALTKHINS